MRTFRKGAASALNRRASAVASAAVIALLALAAFVPVARAVPPVLVASEPASGATNVDPLLGSFSIVFDQPMRNQRSLSVTGPWTAGELLFVGDRSFVSFRGDPGTALPAGATITVTVNPPGSIHPFVNLAGEPAATTSFSFTIAPGSGVPSVVATIPSRGAIDVDPALDAIVVQFSEPMNPSYQSFTLPAAWGTSSVSWTFDYSTLTIQRDDTSEWLPARDLVTLVLNPAGSLNRFRDFDDNLLPETRIAFGIEPYEHFPAVIATDPPNGAVGVAASRMTVSVTFDAPMANTSSVSTSPRWGASTTSWSADRRTLYVTRTNATPLASDSRIQIDLDITPGSIDWLHPPAFMRNPRGDRLPAYSFSFQVAPQVDPPSVVGTDPANGEVRDDPNLAEIVIYFDRPMALGTCAGFSTTGDEWGDPDAPPATDYWSSDFRAYHIVRNNPETLLRTGKEITIRLNPQECTLFSFQGTDGHVLGAYTFTFTIGNGETVLHAVPADPAQGFSWPYYLGIPPALSPHASLLVEPNNTGAVSDDLSVHDRAAEALGAGLANYAAELGVPWLVPVFPRPQTPPIYTHSLDRDTLLATAPGLERIDLQLVAMMADARRRLAERDLAVGPRALLAGFSASGAFVHRFAALHPELVQAVATGSGAGWPLAPVAAWDGITLRYPVGIADLAALVGAPFGATSYRRVPLFVYVGDADENDPVPGWDAVDRDAVFALTGVSSGPIWPRWPVSQEIHEGAAMGAAEFAIYPGVGHTFSSRMQRDVHAFFVAAMPEPDAALGGATVLGVLAWLTVRTRTGRSFGRHALRGVEMTETGRSRRAVAGALLALGASPARAANFTVTSTVDEAAINVGDGVCSAIVGVLPHPPPLDVFGCNWRG